MSQIWESHVALRDPEGGVEWTVTLTTPGLMCEGLAVRVVS